MVKKTYLISDELLLLSYYLNKVVFLRKTPFCVCWSIHRRRRPEVMIKLITDYFMMTYE